jgi:type II secretory pathway pseudopilin PulG
MKTINLLPKPRQRELRFDSVLHSLWVVITLSLISFVLVFLAQYGTNFYLQRQAQDIKAQVVALQDEVGKQQNTNVKNQVQTVNNLIEDYKNLAAASPKWSKVIKAFAPLPPSQLKITTFNVNSSDGLVRITGQSATRDPVIQLYNNILGDSKDFYDIDYPLENISQPTNVSFHFSFYIQKQLPQ